MDATRASLRLELSVGEIPCPRKQSVIAVARCREWQDETKCTCAAAEARGCAVGPVSWPPASDLAARLGAALRAEPERVFSQAELAAVAGPRVFVTPDVTRELVASWAADRVEGGYRAAQRGASAPPVAQPDRLALVKARAEARATTTATTPEEPAKETTMARGDRTSAYERMLEALRRKATLTLDELVEEHGGSRDAARVGLSNLIKRGRVHRDDEGRYSLASEKPRAAPRQKPSVPIRIEVAEEEQEEQPADDAGELAAFTEDDDNPLPRLRWLADGYQRGYLDAEAFASQAVAALGVVTP